MQPRRLVVPGQLAVTVLVLSSACTSPPVPADVVGDLSDARDIANDSPDVDAVPCVSGTFRCLPDPVGHPGATCPAENVCDLSQCPVACPGCAFGSFTLAYGVPCLRDLRQDAGATNCPGYVCESRFCPPTCVTCPTALECVPDSRSDAGPCTARMVCDPSQCDPGCIALG